LAPFRQGHGSHIVAEEIRIGYITKRGSNSTTFEQLKGGPGVGGRHKRPRYVWPNLRALKKLPSVSPDRHVFGVADGNPVN
jgi:hypothetical protein